MMSLWKLRPRMRRRMKLTSSNKSGEAMRKQPKRGMTGQRMTRPSLLPRSGGWKPNRGHQPRLPANRWLLLLRSPGTRHHMCCNHSSSHKLNNKVQFRLLWTSWRTWWQRRWQHLRVRTPSTRPFNTRPQHWHKWSGGQELSRRRTWKENPRSTTGAGG